MTTDEQIVESSTTAVEEVEAVEVESQAAEAEPVATEPIPIEEFSKDQRAEWLKTGEVPKRSKSAEATPADADKETDTAPVKAPKGKGADARIQELLKERHELRTQLEAAKKTPATEAAQPPKQPDTTAPVKPKQDDFEDYTAYEAAKDEYYEALAEYKAEQAVAKREAVAREKQESQSLEDTWRERVAEFQKEYPDFDDVKASQAIPNIETLAPVIVRSEHGPALAKYLMDNPQEAKTIAALHPLDMVKKLAKLETRFEGKSEANTIAPLPSKPISKSGPPARDLSGSASPVDPLKQAIAQGDFATYKKLMNAQEGRK